MLNHERGKTIVMVLHDLNHACRYADHLIAVCKGAIAVSGDPADVVTEAMVRDVFGVDCMVIPDPVMSTPLVVPIGRISKRKHKESTRTTHRPEPALAAG
jgi:iron complex transport system ATP-binding protein